MIAVSDAILLINQLKQYAVSHFAHEEAYMERINDPELKRQRKEHAAFIEKVNSYCFTDVTDESAKSIMLELLQYLSKWLMGHILGSDILIGQFHSVEKPEIPVFDDFFLTGIPLVDEEHKMLFDIIGKVHMTIQTELDLNDVDDNQEAYLYDFLEFLQNWLVSHILKVDKLIPQ